MKLDALGWDSDFETKFVPYRERGLEPARVVREERQLYLVVGERDDLLAEVTGKFRHEAGSRADFPAVGDWVAVQPAPAEARAMIHAVLPRRSKFSRKVPGNKTEEQIVAANIDTVFLVCGLDHEFNPRRIARYLALAGSSGATPVIVLNKADLHDDVSTHLAEVEAIARDVPVHVISALEATGLAALRPHLKRGKTVAVLGSSGVGKSTLINALLGEERQWTNEVREKDSKGRHTTTFRELVMLRSGAMLIDNPGMRELQLWSEEVDLDDAFREIEELAVKCRFSDCRHETEPDCAVQTALADGRLEASRLESYRKLKQEAQRLAMRQEGRARQAEKARTKAITKALRAHYRERPL